MSKLPVTSGEDAVRAFESIGYALDHQAGSHLILRHRDARHRRLVVPNHRESARGALRALIRQAGLTVDDFSSLL